MTYLSGFLKCNTIITVTLNSIETTSVCRLRQQLNELGQGEYRLTVNDFLIKASAAAMKQFPEVNSSWEGDHIRQYNSVDISVAVSTDRGLITPIIFEVDSKVCYQYLIHVHTLMR